MSVVVVSDEEVSEAMGDETRHEMSSQAAAASSEGSSRRGRGRLPGPNYNHPRVKAIRERRKWVRN